VRQLDANFQAHLDTGVTTLAWCWRVTRNDGVRLGFTDHDRDITFDGTDFEASSGLTTTEMHSEIGLTVANLEVSGALRSDRLSGEDLAAGMYDNAKIEVFRVNWTLPEQRVLLRQGTIGEVKRGVTAFAAEVRGLADAMQQDRGRVYQYSCDADLGDSRCGVALAAAAYTGAGAVAALIDPRSFAVTGLDGYAAGWFGRGLLTWTAGANTGRAIEVKRHWRGPAGNSIEVWLDMAGPVAAGDTFSVSAGCDKQFTTCRTKFSNGVNFRGCPYIPGNDFITSYPNSGDGNNNGGSRFQ
jgi:uncharacterized phage protein (TIGR02218 family)